MAAASDPGVRAGGRKGRSMPGNFRAIHAGLSLFFCSFPHFFFFFITFVILYCFALSWPRVSQSLASALRNVGMEKVGCWKERRAAVGASPTGEGGMEVMPDGGNHS
jgi:hypothetical protein